MANDVALEKVAKSIFGITSRRYRQMASDGTVPAVVNGKIDFVAASKAVIEYYRKLAEGQGSLSLTDVRTRKELARAEREELVVKKLKGELIPKDKSIQWLVNLVTEAKMAFLNLPRRMAPVLKTKDDEKDIEFEMRKEIRKILEDMGKSTRASSSKSRI